MGWKYVRYNVLLCMVSISALYLATFLSYPYKQTVLLLVVIFWMIMSMLLGYRVSQYRYRMYTLKQQTEDDDR